MKKTIFLSLLLFFIIFVSCTHNERVQVAPSIHLQMVIDSLINLNKEEKTTSELIIDKGSEYRTFMIFHIGKTPFYDNDILSTCYFLSNDQKVNIYSGIESYFNQPGKHVSYGKIKGIRSNENDLLWIIHMYKDSVVEVYSTNYANPFLLLPPGTSKDSLD